MPMRDGVLTDHQEEMIEGLVRSGRYRDASDVVGDALRLIERREAVDKAKQEAIRAAAQIGIEAIAKGSFREFADADSMVAYLTLSTDDILEAPESDFA